MTFFVCPECGQNAYIQCDACGGRKKTEADARRIREELRKNPGLVIDMECFSRKEVEWISALLSPEERARVMFSWIAPTEAP